MIYNPSASNLILSFALDPRETVEFVFLSITVCRTNESETFGISGNSGWVLEKKIRLRGQKEKESCSIAYDLARALSLRHTLSLSLNKRSCPSLGTLLPRQLQHTWPVPSLDSTARRAHCFGSRLLRPYHCRCRQHFDT